MGVAPDDGLGSDPLAFLVQQSRQSFKVPKKIDKKGQIVMNSRCLLLRSSLILWVKVASLQHCVVFLNRTYLRRMWACEAVRDAHQSQQSPDSFGCVPFRSIQNEDGVVSEIGVLLSE